MSPAPVEGGAGRGFLGFAVVTPAAGTGRRGVVGAGVAVATGLGASVGTGGGAGAAETTGGLDAVAAAATEGTTAGAVVAWTAGSGSTGAFEASPSVRVNRRTTKRPSTTISPDTTATRTRGAISCDGAGTGRGRGSTMVSGGRRRASTWSMTPCSIARSSLVVRACGARSTTTDGSSSGEVRAGRTSCSAWYAAEASPSVMGVVL